MSNQVFDYHTKVCEICGQKFLILGESRSICRACEAKAIVNSKDKPEEKVQ